MGATKNYSTKLKVIIKEDACSKFYDETKPWKTNGMNYSWSRALDNTILRPITCQQVPVKNWKEIQQYQEEDIRNTTWVSEVAVSLLCKGCKYHYGSQATGNNLQERCSHTITETSTYTAEELSVLNKNLYQLGADHLIVDWLLWQNHTKDKYGKIPSIK